MIGETLHVHFPPAFIPTSQTEDMRLSESKSSAYGHQTWPFDSLERQSQFLVEKKIVLQIYKVQPVLHNLEHDCLVTDYIAPPPPHHFLRVLGIEPPCLCTHGANTLLLYSQHYLFPEFFDRIRKYRKELTS